ncbi:hypothetical protein MXB_1563 [Myxobolus squamalis]|nr:hypothetical protein MXB_1563 [Myxobolus squamalis]
MEKMSEEHPWMKVVKINTDFPTKLASVFKILCLPTVIFIIDGVEKKRIIGAYLDKIKREILTHRPALSE